jgi:hypothetical protein
VFAADQPVSSPKTNTPQPAANTPPTAPANLPYFKQLNTLIFVFIYCPFSKLARFLQFPICNKTKPKKEIEMTHIKLQDLSVANEIDVKQMAATTGGFWTPAAALQAQRITTLRYITSAFTTSRYTVNPYSTARYTVSPYSTARYNLNSSPMWR